MSNKKFIKTIAAAALSYYKNYRILPSLTIAQAILESGWGKSDLAKRCNNYFGMKWVAGCGCKYKTYKTQEQGADGHYYTVYAKFRKYSSKKEGIRGYYEFLQYPRYANLRGVTDYREACRLISMDGWATARDYSDRLISLIEQYRLDTFDQEAVKKLKAAESPKNPPKKATKPKPSSQKTTEASFKKGDCVTFDGRVYCNGDGSGGSIRFINTKMWVVDLVDRELYPFYIGLALKKGGVRMGWASTKDIKP